MNALITETRYSLRCCACGHNSGRYITQDDVPKLNRLWEGSISIPIFTCQRCQVSLTALIKQRISGGRLASEAVHIEASVWKIQPRS